MKLRMIFFVFSTLKLIVHFFIKKKKRKEKRRRRNRGNHEMKWIDDLV